MTRMTGPDCVVMCNLINTHTHTHSITVNFFPIFYCSTKPLCLYGSMALLSYIITTFKNYVVYCLLFCMFGGSAWRLIPPRNPSFLEASLDQKEKRE